MTLTLVYVRWKRAWTNVKNNRNADSGKLVLSFSKEMKIMRF